MVESPARVWREKALRQDLKTAPEAAESLALVPVEAESGFAFPGEWVPGRTSQPERSVRGDGLETLG
ncbi:MAG TPA: hypothetical protein VMT62_08625 [Syntrophorhabdaceae bacterium]|nr:hypothetical protein [Syntrophorhabdaceae bacterium]